MSRLGREMSRYLAFSVLKTTLLVWAVLLGFDLIIGFYGTFSNVGKSGYTVNYALLSTLFTAPRKAYAMLPSVAIIGLLLGLGQLASKSELIAMASVGVSRLQIAIGALLPTVLLSLLMIFIYETVGIASEKYSHSLKSYKTGHLLSARQSGIWAKDGGLFFNARSGTAQGRGDSAWLELSDVRLYDVAENGVLKSITRAESASNRNRQWLLFGAERTHFRESGVSVESLGTVPWNSQITDESLQASLTQPRHLGFAELRSNIEYLEGNNLDAKVFRTAYWGRWFYPYKILVLALAVIPFAFGSLRSGGFGKSLFIGILVGVGALLFEQLAVNFSEIYRADVRFAYLLAPLAVFALCWGYLAKRI